MQQVSYGDGEVLAEFFGLGFGLTQITRAREFHEVDFAGGLEVKEALEEARKKASEHERSDDEGVCEQQLW